MMISTRGRYALQVLIDLAEHDACSYIPLKDISARQDISLKYLERIMCLLSKNDLVSGVHGKGGGYKLQRAPENYTLGEILRITEGDLAPVGCLECDAEPCSRAGQCRTYPVWNQLNNMINSFLDSVKLSDLVGEGGSICPDLETADQGAAGIKA